jgi:EamA-like transporter family.
MVVLDAAAPVLLMFGLRGSTPETVSLLNCFEIAATAVIARLFFSEHISKRLTIAIMLITIATLLLSHAGSGSLKFSPGSLLVIAATLCWGLENNCTGAISEKDPFVTVAIKGLGSGSLALLPVLLSGIRPEGMLYPVLAMALGAVTIGASLIFYITAQKGLGAARTSAAYGISPFIGALISFLIYRNSPGLQFLIATAVMATGCLLIRQNNQ